MSVTVIHNCDACRVELTDHNGPRRGHATKISTAHGYWNGEHELLNDEWVGDLCEECMGALIHFVRFGLERASLEAVKAATE